MKQTIKKIKKALPIIATVAIIGFGIGVLAHNDVTVQSFLYSDGSNPVETKYGRIVVSDNVSGDPSISDAAALGLSDLKLWVDINKTSSFSDIEVSGPSYILDRARFGSSTPDALVTVSTVSVAGNILSTDLADLGNTERPICAEASGKVIVCDPSTLPSTNAWVSGTWGICSGGTQTRSVVCQDSNMVTIADSECDAATKPAETQSCSSSSVVNGVCGAANGGSFSSAPTIKLCAIDGGTASAVIRGAGVFSWICIGSGGGTNTSCSATDSSGTPLGDGGTINGTCGDPCTSDANCASGIWCINGYCDAYTDPSLGSPAMC